MMKRNLTFLFLLKTLCLTLAVILLLMSTTIVLAENAESKPWQAKRIYDWLANYKLGEKDSIEFFVHNGYNMAIMVQHQYEGLKFPPRKPKLEDAKDIDSKARYWVKQNPENLAKMEEVLKIFGAYAGIEFSLSGDDVQEDINKFEKLSKENPEKKPEIDKKIKRLKEILSSPYEMLFITTSSHRDFDKDRYSMGIPIPSDVPIDIDGIKDVLKKESKDPNMFWYEWPTMFYLIDTVYKSVVWASAYYDEDGVVRTLFIEMKRKEYEYGEGPLGFINLKEFELSSDDQDIKTKLLNTISGYSMTYAIEGLGQFFFFSPLEQELQDLYYDEQE